MTTAPRFTQGGWGRNIKPASKYAVIFAGRNTHVAMVLSRGLPESEIEGNCDLIASAPRMYEALVLASQTCTDARTLAMINDVLMRVAGR